MVVGSVMAAYFVKVLRPLFVLPPDFRAGPGPLAVVLVTVLAATAVTALAGSSLVNRLPRPSLLRDD